MKIRKILSALLLTICMCGIFLVSQEACAAEMTTVTPNETFYGTLERADAEHYYSFVVDKTGYFTIDFSVVDFAADVKDGWDVELCYADTGTDFYSKTLTSNTVLPVFNFKKGTELYFVVSAHADWNESYAPIGQMYAVNIKSVEDKSWEQESNDTAADAALVTADRTYRGNLYYGKDVDYYEYTVAHTGYFNIDFSLADITADTKDGWDIELCYGDTGTSFYSTTLTSNAALPVFNFKKGTKLYIAVSAYADWNENYAPLWQEYAITIKTTNASDWEKETLISADAAWSTRNKNATSIALGKKYNGSMCMEEDNDLYKFRTDKTGNVTVKFDPDDVESNLGYGYVVRILTKSGKVAAENGRITTVTNVKAYLKKGTYYVEVYRNSTCPVLKKYALTVSHKAQMPAKVSSVKKKGTTVSWKKVSSADGYELSYSKKSNFKGAAKITVTDPDTVSYTLYGLQEKKTYYVRVRAYKTTGAGEKVYGGWSSTVKVKR